MQNQPTSKTTKTSQYKKRRLDEITQEESKMNGGVQSKKYVKPGSKRLLRPGHLSKEKNEISKRPILSKNKDAFPFPSSSQADRPARNVLQQVDNTIG